MSMMVTCPTCQATLRVPPGAETIRCPQCKTVLAIQAPATPAAEPSPPPPPAASSIPLPFARRPTTRAPEPDPEPDPPPPPSRGKPIRAKVIEDHEDEDEDEEPSRAKSSRPRAGSDEAKQQAKLERLEAETAPARMGIRLLAIGALAAMLAPAGVVLYFLSTLYFSGHNPLAWLPVLGMATHWFFTFIGFLCCVFGPRDVRHLALGGAIIVLIHVVSTFALLNLTVGLIDRNHSGFHGLSSEDGFLGSIFYANLFSNLIAIKNLPLIVFLSKGGITFQIYGLLVFAAAIEFTKLSMIGMLANHYAVEGKDPELGHESLRFVYRIFWVVILGIVGQSIILFATVLGFGFVFLSLPAMMLINAYYLWCIFAWVSEFNVLLEVIEVITAERFIEKRARLETY